MIDVLKATILSIILCYFAFEINTLKSNLDSLNSYVCHTDSQCETYDY